MENPVVIGDCTLYLGDCREVLPGLPDGSVDMVFADPPYNVGKKYDEYDDNLPEEEYLEMMRSIIRECVRVSNNRVAFYVSGSLAETYWKLIPGSHMVVIHKLAAGIEKDNYAMQYHALFSTINPVRRTRDLWDDVRLPGEGYYFKEKRYDNPGLTGLVLTKRVLNTFSTNGSTILDPFAGVGTTAVACQSVGRKFIGIERSRKYLDITIDRLKEVMTQSMLPI